MVTFSICLGFLIIMYFIYGRFIEKLFGPDDRETPAFKQNDGIDYIPMPTWKIFMIQFLNIAGLGPIFGAILGAKFGMSSFLWITLGSVFAGATHDYLAGMLSMRHGGESLPETIGRYLGLPAKQIMRVFSLLLMILVGVVFLSGPADLLANLTPEKLNAEFWLSIIFIYYLLATLLTIDKIIGRIYPLFAIALIFMAIGVLVMLYSEYPDIPEIWNGLSNSHPHSDKLPIFPIMFVSIACGAISGFHATQSPMMAKCLKSEKHGRPAFYGAMITEGIVALIWAAAATCFFKENGLDENNAAIIVNHITNDWLGTIGGLLAILGVIAAPISTGDTALRTARLIAADFLKMPQKKLKHRLILTIPIFTITILLIYWSSSDSGGFDVIWRYFAWFNQTLSVFTLWAITIYLTQINKQYLVTLIPAIFMTYVTVSYLFIAPECLNLGSNIAYLSGGIFTGLTLIMFINWKYKNYKLLNK